MSLRFDSQSGLIIVPAEIEGPSGAGVIRLALDTGATTTVINSRLLVAVGYDLALASDRVEVTTGSGIEFAVRLEIARIMVLGHRRKSFPVLAHTLPISAGIDGLLGLDFMRDHVLAVDFRRGRLRLR